MEAAKDLLLAGPRGGFVYESDFDQNGVLYYLATDGGRAAYTNPHDSGKIVVTASSVEQGTLQGFVQHPQGGQRHNYTNDGANSWVGVQLPAGLAVTKYTLRTDKHGHFALRNWNLEGSNDGETWVVLRQHSNDTALAATPMSVASWDVAPHHAGDGGAAAPLRYFTRFRVHMTGPNAYGSNYLMMAGLELYGLIQGGDAVRCLPAAGPHAAYAAQLLPAAPPSPMCGDPLGTHSSAVHRQTCIPPHVPLRRPSSRDGLASLPQRCSRSSTGVA